MSSVEPVSVRASRASSVPVNAHWGGGTSPFNSANLKLSMWMFLGSDTLTFGGLLVGYGMSRAASPFWPAQTEAFNIWLVSAMTFILICSSATMAAAVAAARKGDREAMIRFLTITIIGGLFFIGSQVYEWTMLIQEGARLFSNPWGVPLFTASFFTITGFHGLHVSAGLIYLTATTLKARRGDYHPVSIEAAGLYWHFVDLVWVFVFAFFYLI